MLHRPVTVMLLFICIFVFKMALNMAVRVETHICSIIGLLPHLYVSYRTAMTAFREGNFRLQIALIGMQFNLAV